MARKAVILAGGYKEYVIKEYFANCFLHTSDVTFDTVNNRVNSFEGKPKGDGNWINGGFFVLDPRVIDYIEGDAGGIEWRTT